jgi:hypothetical protein
MRARGNLYAIGVDFESVTRPRLGTGLWGLVFALWVRAMVLAVVVARACAFVVGVAHACAFVVGVLRVLVHFLLAY